MKFTKQDEAFLSFFVILTILSLYLVVNTEDEIANIYSYIIFGCYALLVVNYSIFKVKDMYFIGRMKKEGALIPIILGLLLGTFLVFGIISSSFAAGDQQVGENAQEYSIYLSVPREFALTLGQVPLVFLLAIMVGVVEEVFFRALLFPFFAHVVRKENLSIAFWLGVGLLLIFMTDLQIAGWGMIILGLYDKWKKGVLIKNENMRFWLTATKVSVIFANFHMTAYKGDFSLLVSAFVFSMVACYLYKSTKSLIAPLLAHTFNNAVIISVVVLHVPIIYPIIMTGVFALMLYALSTKTLNISKALSLKGIGIR